MFGSKTSKIDAAIEKKKSEVLVKFIYDKDMSVRVAAIAGLGKVKGDNSYNALITLLRDPEAQVRAAAATALGEMGDPKARAHIDHMISSGNEKDAKVIEAMKAALGKVHNNE